MTLIHWLIHTGRLPRQFGRDLVDRGLHHRVDDGVGIVQQWDSNVCLPSPNDDLVCLLDILLDDSHGASLLFLAVLAEDRHCCNVDVNAASCQERD